MTRCLPLSSSRRRLLCAGLAAASVLAGTPALAQGDYPNRLIRIVVPNAAGTTSDNFARVIGNELSKRWKVPVIVDNRAGADGRIAARYLVSTPPDGYTLFLGTTSTHAINPLLFKDAGYDPVKDMTIIALMTQNSVALCVPAASPIKSLREFLAAFKAPREPKNIAGGTSLVAIGTQAFLSMANLQMTYVPYKSTAAALQDLMGGQVDAMFVDLGNGLSQIRAGTLRALATASTTRPKALPEVPTLEEAGFPGIQMTGWSVLAAPVGVAPAVVDKLNREVLSIMSVPEVAKVFTGNGSEIVSMNAAQANDYVRSENRRWRELMARSGIKLE